jgi:hypothetical protein
MVIRYLLRGKVGWCPCEALLMGGWARGGEPCERVRRVGSSKSQTVTDIQPFVVKEVMGVLGTFTAITGFPLNLKNQKPKLNPRFIKKYLFCY